MTILQRALDVARGKIPASMPRSPHWPAHRAAWLKCHPTCAVCGGTRKLQVHHILPFHLFPSQELNPANLITLCETGEHGINCHLGVGHFGWFKSFNVDVEKDAAAWMKKLFNRPNGETP